jgi:hypothetical protein
MMIGSLTMRLSKSFFLTSYMQLAPLDLAQERLISYIRISAEPGSDRLFASRQAEPLLQPSNQSYVAPSDPGSAGSWQPVTPEVNKVIKANDGERSKVFSRGNARA